jgi:hypothetical protein
MVDSAEVLAGERGADGEVVAIRTRQPLLVKLLSWYIWHSIALATLLNDLNDHLEGVLDPETRARLASPIQSMEKAAVFSSRSGDLSIIADM